MEHFDAVIIGGGPTGLAAARKLADLGITKLMVLEREAEVGGVPRHCGHGGFGWQSHYRWWTGPRFAQELRQSVEGLDVRTGTTVLELKPHGVLRLCDNRGCHEVQAQRVLLATGTRETTRAARLTGGARPQGVMNTGALQQHVYLQGHAPFKRPVIVGSEWVSYSALLTCRHLGIQPVAMLEEAAHTTAPRPGPWFAKHYFGTPVRLSTRIVAIHGHDQVEAVELDCQGQRETLACDGVIMTGKFRPESALFAPGLFDMQEHSPRIDAHWRCSDPAYFAAGNSLGPLKASGNCWKQGVAAARSIAESLR